HIIMQIHRECAERFCTALGCREGNSRWKGHKNRGQYHPLLYKMTSQPEGKKMSVMMGYHLHPGPLMASGPETVLCQAQQLKVVRLRPLRDHHITHQSQAVLLAWTGMNLGLHLDAYQGLTCACVPLIETVSAFISCCGRERI
ncbi:hypothetical protein M9458_002500, partial [Cirrhinus mrigala]